MYPDIFRPRSTVVTLVAIVMVDMLMYNFYVLSKQSLHTCSVIAKGAKLVSDSTMSYLIVPCERPRTT